MYNKHERLTYPVQCDVTIYCRKYGKIFYSFIIDFYSRKI